MSTALKACATVGRHRKTSALKSTPPTTTFISTSNPADAAVLSMTSPKTNSLWPADSFLPTVPARSTRPAKTAATTSTAGDAYSPNPTPPQSTSTPPNLVASKTSFRSASTSTTTSPMPKLSTPLLPSTTPPPGTDTCSYAKNTKGPNPILWTRANATPYRKVLTTSSNSNSRKGISTWPSSSNTYRPTYRRVKKSASPSTAMPAPSSKASTT